MLFRSFLFIVSGVFKLITLMFFMKVNTFNDLQVQPLSLSNFFDKNSLETFYQYPLSVLNVFEVLYVLVLAWIISDLIGKSFFNSFRVVATSYGVGLLLWVLFVMFMNITMT